MNDKEKMRVIRNWTYKFTVNAPSARGYHGGHWYGRVVFTIPKGYGIGSQYLGPCTAETSVIHEAYKLVQDLVWKMVGECG